MISLEKLEFLLCSQNIQSYFIKRLIRRGCHWCCLTRSLRWFSIFISCRWTFTSWRSWFWCTMGFTTFFWMSTIKICSVNWKELFPYFFDDFPSRRRRSRLDERRERFLSRSLLDRCDDERCAGDSSDDEDELDERFLNKIK